MTWIGTDWHGLARIGQDWQIGKFVSDQKVDPRLAQDWHGLARIGLIGQDWQIGEFVSKRKIGAGLASDWHRIGTRLADWHWIDRLTPEWPICTGWLIGNGFADRHQIGSGLARIGSDWLGLANWRICVVTKN